MSKSKDYLKVLNGVNWIAGNLNFLPRWQKQHIHHGFEGYKGSSPVFRHVRQVHGARVVDSKSCVESTEPAHLEADGIYSLDPKDVIGVKTADCLPILFHTPEIKLVVHAGWRGLAQGILQSAAEVLEQHRQDMSKVLVGLGPCISPGRFEVGPEVLQALINDANHLPSGSLGFFLMKGVSDRWHVDLAVYSVFQLLQVGISPENIDVLRSCTFDNYEYWASYRRNATGSDRIISWIG